MFLWYKYNAWDVFEAIHMTNLRKCLNLRFRTHKEEGRYHVIVGVSQGCPLSLKINYLIQYIHFHSSYMMTYLCVKFKENPCVGTSVTPPFWTPEKYETVHGTLGKNQFSHDAA